MDFITTKSTHTNRIRFILEGKNPEKYQIKTPNTGIKCKIPVMELTDSVSSFINMEKNKS